MSAHSTPAIRKLYASEIESWRKDQASDNGERRAFGLFAEALIHPARDVILDIAIKKTVTPTETIAGAGQALGMAIAQVASGVSGSDDPKLLSILLEIAASHAFAILKSGSGAFSVVVDSGKLRDRDWRDQPAGGAS